MTDRTLVLCKPDAVERGLAGEIIRRIEAKHLTIVALLELRTLDKATAEAHYAEHDGKPFFGELVELHHPQPASWPWWWRGPGTPSRWSAR